MTIYALATAPGRAAVAAIRVSGPAAGAAVEALAGRPRPAPRTAGLRVLRDAEGRRLDRALVLWFPGPASVTGEDVAEFHVHGGRAVVRGVLDALGRLPGLRPAQPGEFTRRAVLNGKLDLTAAEAVADLVDAGTARQRDQALDQMEGSLRARCDGWRDAVLACLAEAEALIDFADEDLPETAGADLPAEARRLAGDIGARLADGRRGERLREGLRVAILGAPNVGKSSLLNALVRRDAAIVSEEAGATRDVVEASADVDGWPVVLADTAGLRETRGAVEREGVRRALERARTADLRLLLADAARWEETLAAVAGERGPDALLVATKRDLAAAPREADAAVSCVTGAGLDDLLALMARRFEAAWTGAGPSPTRERHRAALEQARAALDRAAGAREPELAAEDLRLAAAALGRIVGRVDVEQVLDRIFAEFCIGK